jgi:hypothetical protein
MYGLSLYCTEYHLFLLFVNRFRGFLVGKKAGLQIDPDDAGK